MWCYGYFCADVGIRLTESNRLVQPIESVQGQLRLPFLNLSTFITSLHVGGTLSWLSFL